MYTLLPFMDAVLSEERQLMKWVEVFQVGIFWMEIFRRKFSGWEFFWGKFSKNRFKHSFSLF